MKQFLKTDKASSLVINVEKYTDDGAIEYCISSPGCSAYGAGSTFFEAMTDFISMLQDIYEDFSESEDVLSQMGKKELEKMRAIILD